MRIGIVCPENAPRRSGNYATASRWRKILRALGHRTTLTMGYDGRDFDLLVVLHARSGAESAARFRTLHPQRPLVVAGTGTDLYVDLPRRPAVGRTLRLADRVIVLQPAALEALPEDVRPKAAVIRQSVVPSRARRARHRRSGDFEVVVVAGLRRVKDPLRTAYAARLLAPQSRVRVTLVGPAIDPRYADLARAEMRRNPRFRWIGEVSPGRARALIRSADLLVLSSRSEGGANVVGEALIEGTPILSTRIDGSIGMLGADYPGYFEVGDTQALAALLARCESDAGFRRLLRSCGRKVAPLFAPGREAAAWKAFLAELPRFFPRA